MRKTKVIIAQLGSPKEPTASALRSYLRDFLGDPRVVDTNPVVWKIILNLFVLPFRPKKSAKAYKNIWDAKNKTFPLVSITKSFTNKLATIFKSRPDIEFNHAFLLCEPKPKTLFEQWSSEDPATRADSVLILPQFPQYSESTIASVFDKLAIDTKELVNFPHITFVSHYHRAKCFIDNYVSIIQSSLTNDIDHLVFSFHGIPLRRVEQKKDLYYQHCFETYKLITERLNFERNKIHLCFQSRFGSEQWLGPATDEYTVKLARAGAKKIAVVCPSFTVDCLETTDEIGNELGHELKAVGCELVAVACPNDDDRWVNDYAQFISTTIDGNLEEKRALYYQVDETKMAKELPKQEQVSPPLTKEMKTTLRVVFLAVFLDLIGFSIIFPLFPALAKYYLQVDADNFFLRHIWSTVEWIAASGGQINFRPVVLFGGILGALYSLLQFISAPLWGSLSDRIGRKPVMLFTISGLFLSYVLWIFSGSFTLLIVARLVGGLMGGNLSTATAIVSDVTDEKRRSKGMAFIGIAFAFGFIFGPAMGGLLSLIDLTKIYPTWESFGVNPFSVPAIVAAVLSLVNIFMIVRSLKETKPATVSTSGHKRTANPLKLFKPLKSAGVNQTNLAYFLFITAFSGMEFTLTFLAVERLSFTSMDNGLMFIFIGFIIALIQGGYVRRKANIIGEDKMAFRGLTVLIPGLLIISQTHSTGLLYLGLFFLSVGSAMAIPCLTSLVSFYAPRELQGTALGTFRSLGSLGRVIGPFFASVLYWKYGSAIPYFVGAAALILPMVLIKRLPTYSQN